MEKRTVPPETRTPAWQPMNAAAATEQFVLPTCTACGAVQYPVQEFCGQCLGAELEWVAAEPAGILLSWTWLHVSLEPFFREHVPWPVGLVKLACGPVVIVHLADGSPETGKPVRVLNRLDKSGAAVLIAVPTDTDDNKLGPVVGLLVE